MELKINSKKEEPLLSRTKIDASIQFQNATPSYPEVTKQMAGILKVDENVVALRNIYTSFGLKNAKVIAYVYKDESAKKNVEPKVKVRDPNKTKTKAKAPAK